MFYDLTSSDVLTFRHLELSSIVFCEYDTVTLATIKHEGFFKIP